MDLLHRYPKYTVEAKDREIRLPVFLSSVKVCKDVVCMFHEHVLYVLTQPNPGMEKKGFET
jgi:hypothetical protein